jgi:cytochrome P450
VILTCALQTNISITYQDILHNPTVFPEPHSFEPDRWLRAAERGERLDKYLVTFSKGSRSCLGMELAMCELYLGIATLVHYFDIELYDFDYERDLKTVRDGFVGLPGPESKGVRIKLSARS